MSELPIHTHVNSRYQILDASGRLPFSIVFGLCRRSSVDTDPRSICLEIAGSALDVPYALTHGLLTIHEIDPQDKGGQWVEVDLSRLNKVAPKKAEWLSLSSPVNRTEHWRDAFTAYQGQFDISGELASILKPGTKYVIRLASKDLGVKRWAYSDENQLVDNDEEPGKNTEGVELVNSKSTAGNAAFKLVKSLSWPPRIETRMRLCVSSPSSDPSAKPNGSPTLEVSIMNTDSDPVTVQTRGRQRILTPWGPFQPEPDADDDRLRILDARPPKPPTSSLQVIESSTGKVIRGNEKQSGIAPLTDSNADHRPKVEHLVKLQPETPVIRSIDIGRLVHGLADGQYKIRMGPKGCRWWWSGEVQGEEKKENKDENENGDGKVPARLCKGLVPPLMLESSDEVELQIREGKVQI